MSDKIKEKKERLKEVENLLQDPLILRDREKLISLSREQKELQEVARLADDYGRILKDIKDTEQLIASDEEEISKLAKEEISSLQAKKDYIGRELVGRLTPQDIDSDRNVILEIRAGAGGEEASLFAKDLYRMYSRYAERQGWLVEPIVVKHTEVGGIKELIFLIKGLHAYSRLKFESGVHRVQRVPVTESGGRIHTSTCTVAVLSEAKETDVAIDPKDIKMDFFRASGHGGQNVNKLSTAVRICHIPTGITVECQDERSQYKNRQRAMQILLARLYEMKKKKEEEKIRKERKTQIGTGDRSLKIRTYNFRENRVTDHRINLTLYKLDSILNGELDTIINKLTITDIIIQ
ncbi:MAG: peptide chain release factor 1 [bacterium (Candidatus Stahlbacteria) CG23_combo_of_CG06-09_8_20_14_all_40_9]|nr:MAG: peptide chain release factor 1 [bacterium (Candidatus Stahlbacteria) CG23_combo_of_CG06-09_8_20_14_all_40_9]